MASSASYPLAAVALAALFAISSCSSPLTFTVGEDSTSTKLVLVASSAISDVSVKEKGAADWSDDLKESPEKTFTLESKEPIKGPISVRWSVKGADYRVVDDIIPEGFKPGSVYKTGEQV